MKKRDAKIISNLEPKVSEYRRFWYFSPTKTPKTSQEEHLFVQTHAHKPLCPVFPIFYNFASFETRWVQQGVKSHEHTMKHIEKVIRKCVAPNMWYISRRIASSKAFMKWLTYVVLLILMIKNHHAISSLHCNEHYCCLISFNGHNLNRVLSDHYIDI